MPTPTKTEQTLKKGIALLEKQLAREDLSVQARVEITKSLAKLTGQLARFYERRKTAKEPRRPGRPSSKKTQPLDPLHDPESPYYLPPGESIPNLCGEPVKAPEPPAPEQKDPGPPVEEAESTSGVGSILGSQKPLLPAQEPPPVQKADDPQPEPPPRNAPAFLINAGAPVDLWRPDTAISKAPKDQALFITNFQLAFAPGWMGDDGRRRLEEQAVHMPENSYEARLLKLFRWVWQHYRDRYYEIRLPGEGVFSARTEQPVDPRVARAEELRNTLVAPAGERYETSGPRGLITPGILNIYGDQPSQQTQKESFDPWADDANNEKPKEPEF